MPGAEKKLETRQAILKGCERGLAKYGYRKLTIEHIAAEAGVAKRTVYLHFENKGKVCLAGMDESIDRSLAAMDEVFGEGRTGVDTLRKVLLVRLLDRLDRFLPYHHALEEAVRAVYPGKVQNFRGLAAPDIERVARAIRMGLDDGTLRRCDPEETAEMLVRGTNGFLPSALSREEVRETEALRARIEAFIDLIVRGMASG